MGMTFVQKVLTALETKWPEHAFKMQMEGWWWKRRQKLVVDGKVTVIEIVTNRRMRQHIKEYPGFQNVEEEFITTTVDAVAVIVFDESIKYGEGE